jgi:hypothetical protein
MSHNVADGAPLVAAAVQAAIRESASVRMVAAVAAAVAGKVLSAAAQPTWHATKRKEHTQDAPMVSEADNPEQLLATLRAARRAQRHRKKQRRREAKQAAISPPPAEDAQQNFAETLQSAGTAGQRAEHVGAPAAAPAPVPHSPDAATSAAGAASPEPPREQPPGLPLQRPPKRSTLANEFRSELADLGISDAGSRSNMTASDIASSGMPPRDRSPRKFDPGRR